jgi:hypothetical protein
VDLLTSGAPQRPRRRGRWRPRLPLPPRGVLVAVGLLVAAAVALGLRAGTGPVVPAVPDPTPVAEQPVDLPTGPFEHLPGRIPIPEPTRDGELLAGALPATGGPDEAAALRAAQLVLGRYCGRPDRYTLTAAPQEGWLVLGVLAVGLDRGGDGALIDLMLTWSGRAYQWSGSLTQLRRC